MSELRVVIAPSPSTTRVLVTEHDASGTQTLLKAHLRADPSHPRALQWLLEALALWQGQTVHAALVADGTAHSYGTHLYGDWFAEHDGALYRIELVERRGRRAHRDRVRAMGSFGDLRQLVLFRGGERR
jgi:hypothetical protein